MTDQQREPSCDCLKETNALLVAQEQCRIPFMFSLTGETPNTVYIQTDWTGKPKRGKKPPKLICTFCPWCGIKYGWKSTDRVDAMTGGAS